MYEVSRLVVVLLLLIGLAGCKGSLVKPDGPSDNYPAIDKNADLDPDAERHEVLPAGKQYPLEFGLSDINPPKGSQLTVGQPVSLSWICGSAQGGYQAVIKASFVTDPVGSAKQPELFPSPRCKIQGASVFRVGLKCDSVKGKTFTVQADTPNITSIYWQVWLSPDGVPFDWTDRCPDAEIFEPYFLRGPSSK